MISEKRVRRRLVALFLFGLILFSYPILSLFNHDVLLFGFPLLHLYLFSFWTVLIIAVIVVSNTKGEKSR